MGRDEPVDPHEQEVRAYEQEIRAHKEKAHGPPSGIWLVIPLIGLRTRGVVVLASALFVASLSLAVIYYQTPEAASAAPMLLLVAIVMGLVAAYYGVALHDETRDG